MSIKRHFIFWTIIVATITIALSFMAATHGIFALYASEFLTLAVFIFLLRFYKKIIKPFQTLSEGMNLLQEQDFNTRLNKVQQAESDQIIETFNQMVDQLKNERLQLQEQDYFLNLLINASPMGVVVLSLNQEVSIANPTFAQVVDIPVKEMIGKRLDTFDSPFLKRLSQIPETKAQIIRLKSNSTYKCTHASFADKGFRRSFFLIEILTEEISLVEKQSYEKVIRVISHEVNNTITGVTSTLDILKDELPDKNDRALLVACIDRQFSLAQFITRFANVVKIPQPDLHPTSLLELLNSCKQIMEYSCHEHRIDLSIHSQAGNPIQLIDATLMEQVIINIIKNSIESIGEGGFIRLEIPDEQSIEIIDNGQGITPEQQDDLFTPFYSTKPQGQGIGLMLIKEILTKHHCYFSLCTHPDQTTHFLIHFPEKPPYQSF